MKYTVYIDESGGSGIGKIRGDGTRGASPYLVLSAAVIPFNEQDAAREVLKNASAKIPRKLKHATDLNHFQKLYLCKQLSGVNMRMFAAVSYKRTLEDYAEKIDWDPHKYYNKCVHYLLETVGQYLKGKGLFDTELEVVFEGRNHNFNALRRYIGKIKDNPINERAKFLQCFNPFSFVERAKIEEDLLKYADLAAHSVFSCVNKTKTNFSIPETRYLVELQSRFGADSNGRVLDYGLKCIHSIDQLKLDADVKLVWQSLRAEPRVPISK